MAYPYIGGSPNGGGMPSPGPTMIVIHSIESPLRAGYARSLGNWFASGAAGTSVHYIVDPDETIQLLPENVIGWHVGTGNTRTIGIEQSGYAKFSRGEWLTDDGRRQLSRVASLVGDLARRWGIPLRWLDGDPASIRAAHNGDRSRGGVVTHRAIAQALGGSDHWDPGYSYPHDLLMAAAGGAATPTEEDGFLMALSDAEQAGLRQQVYNNGAALDQLKKAVSQLQADLSYMHKRNLETQDPNTYILAANGKPWRYIEDGKLHAGALDNVKADQLRGDGVGFKPVSEAEYVARLKKLGEAA